MRFPIFRSVATLSLISCSLFWTNCTSSNTSTSSWKTKHSVESNGNGSSGQSSIVTSSGGTGPGEDFFTEDIQDGTSASTISDPLIGYNRFMFAVNDRIYRFVLRPIGKGYGFIMPDPVERGVTNVFDNLGYPKRLAGNLLQGKFKGAAKETGKFVVNTTVGIAGIMDPANSIESLQTPDDEDLGQAFGSWGIGHGPYLIVPVLGPFSTRDAVGRFGEIYLNPFHYVEDAEVALGARVLKIVNSSPELLERYEALKEASLDPYVSAKDAYVQFRDRKLMR